MLRCLDHFVKDNPERERVQDSVSGKGGGGGGGGGGEGVRKKKGRSWRGERTGVSQGEEMVNKQTISSDK